MRLVTYPPLPRKVRARLAWEHGVNVAATWFSDHGLWRVSKLIWRVTGLWD